MRESVSHIISIENPTELEVTIPATEFSAVKDEISIEPETLVIPPRSERGFEISFRPLVASEEEDLELTLTNSVLGLFKYALKLKGLENARALRESWERSEAHHETPWTKETLPSVAQKYKPQA